MDVEFVEKVQMIMHIQQFKHAEKSNIGNYYWLIKSRPVLEWMTHKEENAIRHKLRKLEDSQKVKIINQLFLWIDEHPNTINKKVPEVCLMLLQKELDNEVLVETTLTRIASFRRSLRRLTIVSNKVVPSADPMFYKTRKSVSFNEIPTIYTIKND